MLWFGHFGVTTFEVIAITVSDRPAILPVANSRHFLQPAPRSSETLAQGLLISPAKIA